MIPQTLVFVDCETTGLDRFADEIIELAAVRVHWPTWTTEAVYYQRFRPTVEVSVEAAKVNGYTEKAWTDAPDIYTSEANGAFARFVQLTDGARWIGSMPQFDYDFCESTRRHACPGVSFALASRRLIDVGALGAPLLFAGHAEKGGLDELCTVLGVSVTNEGDMNRLAHKTGGRLGPHTAMGDALRTAAVFRRLMLAFTTIHALAPLFPPRPVAP